MTVPLIVEIIFRFIPSALLVFGFIEINLTAKYNKYIQFIAINTVYLFAGLFGQYMREKYKLEFFDFVLAVALVLIYSIETYHGLTTSKTLQLRCFQSS